MIDVDEEVELARRIREGDTVALERLVNANLRFVVSIAKQYQNQGLALGDLVNEGNLGLIKAAKKFDETRGFKFISYAVWWIRQSILQAIADFSRIVRLPLNKHGLISKISKIAGTLEQRLQREPTIEEIAEESGMPIETIMDFYIINESRRLYLDSPISGESDEERTYLNVLEKNDEPAPDWIMIDESLKKEIHDAIELLQNEKERQALKYYFGLDGYSPMKLEEISEKMNITRERARQLKEQGLRKLRKKREVRDALREFL